MPAKTVEKSTRFYYQQSDPAPEDRDFSHHLDQQSLADTQQAISQLIEHDATDNTERFQQIRDYLAERQRLQHEQLNGGEDFLPAITESFNTLAGLSEATDSVYAKRLLQWGMMREAHFLDDAYGAGILVDIDQTATKQNDPEALAKYFADDIEDGWQHGLVYSLTEQGQAILAQHPNTKPILDFMCQTVTKYPALGDSDYYAPDPYIDLMKPGGNDDLNGDDSEFAIETANLFGLNSTADVSDHARQQLFTVGVGLNESQYSRIKVVAARYSPERRQQFAEAFLATEFGDDYGDAILDITEHATPEQAGRALETINSLRTRTHEYTHALYHAIDPELAVADERALNETITSMLVSLSVVAVEGELHEDVSPGNNVPGHESARSFAIDLESFDESLEVLQGLNDMFRTKLAILRADDLRITKVNEDESQFVIYRFMSEKEGNFLWYIRPEGAHGYDRQYEYGNRKGVEASTSTIVNPENPHELLLPKDSGGVSIRFDREGRQVGEAPDSADRDPTRADGLISVDVSSIMGPADSLAVRIGRMIAAGNRIRARRQGTPDSLHHNTNYLDQEKYGHAAGFADLAGKTINQVEMLRRATRGKRLGKRATATR